MKENLIKKFLKFSYGSWIGLFIGLGLTMLTTRILPPDAFGKFSMYTLFLQVGMILTIFGTDQSFVRFFYEESEDKRGALLYNSLKLPIITTLVLLVFISLFGNKITFYMVGKESIILSSLLAIGVILQLINRYALLVIRMQQKANLYSILQIIQRSLNIIFIILFFFMLGARYEILIYAHVLVLLFLTGIAVYFGRNLWSFRNLQINNVKHTQKQIFVFGAPFVLTIFITWLFESFDKIALRQWSTFEELGLYAAAMKLVAMVMVIRQTFSTFWVPVAYEKFENEPEDKDFFRQISIIITFVMFLVAIASIAGKDIVVKLLGSEFSESAKIMPFLVFMPILYTISETTVMGINFYKKTKWHILIALIACIVNIIGNWILVPKYGALGASLSTAFAYIVFFILRTQISYIYFKVQYPLIKIYIMLIVISSYAVYSINSNFILKNILISFIPLTILIILFYNNLIYIYKNRRSIF